MHNRVTQAFARWNAWLRSHGVVLGFLAAATAVVSSYIEATPYDSRTHDVRGHLEHVDYVVAHNAPPPTTACWECYHPPLYYFTASAALFAARAHSAGLDAAREPDYGHSNAKVLQRLSGLYLVGTILFALLTIEAIGATFYERVLASALVTFWPSLTIEGAKIGNDAPTYFFTAMMLYGLVRWHKTLRPGMLVLAAAGATLALLSKLNGAIAVIGVVTCVVAEMLRAPRGARTFPRGIIPAVLILCAGVGLTAYTYVHFKHGQFAQVGDVDATLANQGVSTTLEQFTSLRLDTFLRTPWPWPGGGAQDNFWNFLLRTSLYTEAGGDGTQLALAYGLLLLVVPLALFAARGAGSFAARAVERGRSPERPLPVIALGLIAAAAVFRARFPYVCSDDFRYILPVVVPLSVMSASGAFKFHRRFRGNTHLAAAPGFVVTAFCLCSLCFLFSY